MHEWIPFYPQGGHMNYKDYFFFGSAMMLLTVSIVFWIFHELFAYIFKVNRRERYQYSIFSQKVEFLKRLGYEVRNHNDINNKLKEIYRDIKKRNQDSSLAYDVESVIFAEDGEDDQEEELRGSRQGQILNLDEINRDLQDKAKVRDYSNDINEEELEEPVDELDNTLFGESELEDTMVKGGELVMLDDSAVADIEIDDSISKIPDNILERKASIFSRNLQSNFMKNRSHTIDIRSERVSTDLNKFATRKPGFGLEVKIPKKNSKLPSEIASSLLPKTISNNLTDDKNTPETETGHKDFQEYFKTRLRNSTFNKNKSFLKKSSIYNANSKKSSFIGNSFVNKMTKGMRKMSMDSQSRLSISRADMNLVKEVKRHEKKEEFKKFLPVFLENKKQPPKNFKTRQLIARIFLLISVFSFILIFNIGSGFGILPISLAIGMNYIVFLVVIIKDLTGADDMVTKGGMFEIARKIFSIKHGYWRKSTVVNALAHWCHAFNEFNICCYFSFIFIGIFAVLLAVAFKSSCVTFTESYIGLSFSGYFTISSQLLRMFTIQSAYQLLNPCHVYVTLPSHGHSSIFVNVQLKSNRLYSLERLYFDSSDFYDEHGFMRYSTHNPYKEAFGGDLGQRDVYTFKIDNLKPNWGYSFMLEVNGKNYSKCVDNKFDFKVKTLPASWTEFEEVNFIVAGNVGVSDRMKKQVELLNDFFEPGELDLMVFGGNVAMDNGCIMCHYLWNEILSQFGEVFNHTGRIVPIIIAAGEYDVGHQPNSVLTSPAYHTHENYPSMILDFPQHLDSSLNIPLPSERKSYFVHQFGLITLITLDSGSFYRIDDKHQLQFLEKSLKESINTLRMVLISDSLFPACVKKHHVFDFEVGYKVLGPIFDKYNVTVVFENGSNYFKRTKKIFKGIPGSIGTVYLGDGNFGTETRECTGNNLDGSLFEKLGPDNHFWWIKHTPTGAHFKAIEIKGNEIDSFSLDLS